MLTRSTGEAIGLFYRSGTPSGAYVRRVDASGASVESPTLIASAVNGGSIAATPTSGAAIACAYSDGTGSHVAVVDYATSSAVVTPTYDTSGYVNDLRRVGDELVLAVKSGSSTGVQFHVLGLDGTLPNGSTPIPSSDDPHTFVEDATSCEGPAGEALFLYTTLQLDSSDPGTRLRARRAVDPKDVGGSCDADAHCALGHCVDGVCCDEVCGGNSTGDCLACSTAAGASANGACTTLTAAHVCRPSVGACDAAESCSGSSTCGPDLAVNEGTTCAASSGICDADDVCQGIVGATATCAVRVADASVVCRVSGGVCDAVERCDGLTSTCPSDLPLDSGTSCDDGAVCSLGSSCSGFACVTTMTNACDDQDPCTSDTCGEPGGCAHSAIAGCGDAGVSDGGASDADGGTGPSPRRSGGCAVRPEGRDARPPSLVLALVAAAVLSRRRRLLRS